MKNPQLWVPPLSKIPASLVPITRMQIKHYGDVLYPTRWWGRMPRLFWLVALFVGWLERKKARLSPELRAMLMTRVSQQCHCAFCIDANTLRLAQRCDALEKVQAVAQWQNSTLFSEAERAALAYADAMTATPPVISEAQKSALKNFYNDDQICELTALVAFQNLSARFNAALEIPSQGLCSSERKPHA
ncbi:MULTISPECIES: carboxymuconolactone decarboxylase family protein [Enterobacterales]|uniref:carboxymuconolactone decarboxylase family protein n=1 Tax=Enterobacterales TaxID=91347 RepID=UPI002ED87370